MKGMSKRTALYAHSISASLNAVSTRARSAAFPLSSARIKLYVVSCSVSESMVHSTEISASGICSISPVAARVTVCQSTVCTQGNCVVW
eukprot:3295875-Rhodomonas_salina.1